MKKTLFVYAMLIALGCRAQSPPDDGITPPTSPSPIKNVQKITIAATGLTAGKPDPAFPDCKTFILSDEDVKNYFKEAREVTRGVYSHMLDWSQCYAYGMITLENGETATWNINQGRGGYVDLKNGESIHLYCAKCTAKGFPPAE